MKQIIRQQIKERLESIPKNPQVNKELLLVLQPLLDRATTIAIYHAHDLELNLCEVIAYSLDKGKRLYQPISYRETKHMLLMQYDPNYTNIFSDSGFVPANAYQWYNLDLILLPLIAADNLGARLGRGGGYYDTTLAEVINQVKRPILCGVGFDLQLIADPIPKNEWDIHLDYFASEQRFIKF